MIFRTALGTRQYLLYNFYHECNALAHDDGLLHLFLQCFAEWLLPLTEYFPSLSTEVQLQGVVFVVWCLFRLKIPLDNFDVVAATPILLRLLSKHHSSVDEQSQWEDFNLLRSIISEKADRSEVVVLLIYLLHMT